MPAQYEAIRDSCVAAGKPLSLAKRLAAMTYNAHRRRGMAPVTGRSDGGGTLSAIAATARMK
jgi:hypothetical protein